MAMFAVSIADGGGGKPAKVSTKVTIPAAKAAAASVIKGAMMTVAKATSKPASAAQKQNSTTKSQTAAAPASAGTPEVVKENVLIQWHDVKFFANASEVRGFSNLSVSSSVETEDKENGGTKYVSKKNSKGYEVSITAYFDKRLGVGDVKKAAMTLVNYGANGQTGYMYAQGEKLVSSVLMLTSAKAGNIIMAPNGMWISCEVTMTLKTCSKLDGSTTSQSSGGGYKYSVRVYYSGSSGAVSSVVGYSNVSVDDARKKAWAKVPKTAMWASETPKQATNQSPPLTDAALEAARKRVQTQKQQTEAAKTQSSGTGLLVRINQVIQKKLQLIK